jgi:hypothetical protein
VDQHAAHNTTSVYTGAQIFPMLPERLSTDLTSLGEHEDRNAIVVEYVVNDEGAVDSSDVYEAGRSGIMRSWRTRASAPGSKVRARCRRKSPASPGSRRTFGSRTASRVR